VLTRRVAAIAVTTIAVVLLPVAAYADSPPVPDITIVDSLGLPAIVSQAAPCQLAESDLWAADLTATVERKANGELDFNWHAFAYATVSSADPCVTGVMVKTQLTDSTTVPNCPPIVRSDEVSTANNDPFTSSTTGEQDYEVYNDVHFAVAYFGGPGTTASAEDAAMSQFDKNGSSSPDLDSTSVKCYRLRSTVTEQDTAYYANSQGQFIPFCSQQVAYEFVATPSGPQQVGDPITESITC